jgi:hypothetical protein
VGRKTNRDRRQASAASAREKAAAARAAQARVEQRRRAIAILSSVVAIAVVAAVIAVVALNHKGKTGPATVASQAVVSKVTSVPASVTDGIGAGDAQQTGLPESIQGGTSLESNNKPTLLYIGAEFCPFCAAQRWALVQALSRFGTFSGLKQIRSSEDDIATFTFLDATYKSKYINFDSKEQADQNHNNLQSLTSTEQAQWTKYLAPGSTGPGYPFMDFNGQYVSVDPMVDPTILEGKTWAQISSALSDPSSPIAKAIDGSANYITSVLCSQTGNQPASVCTAKIQSLTQGLAAYKA